MRHLLLFLLSPVNVYCLVPHVLHCRHWGAHNFFYPWHPALHWNCFPDCRHGVWIITGGWRMSLSQHTVCVPLNNEESGNQTVSSSDHRDSSSILWCNLIAFFPIESDIHHFVCVCVIVFRERTGMRHPPVCAVLLPHEIIGSERGCRQIKSQRRKKQYENR